MNTATATKTPWHLWVVGVVGLIWFAGGANDYIQTQTGNVEYLGAMAETVGVSVDRILDYYGNFPVWADAAWAFGVWGAVAGAVLLLLRSRFATYAFIASILGLVGTTIYTLASDIPDEFNSPLNWVFTALIWLSVIGAIIYSRRMTAAGVLR